LFAGSYEVETMRVSLKKSLARKSPERRTRIAAEAKRMIAEELTLRDLRKAHKMSQKKLAAMLGLSQVSVSNFEKRSNMRLSTLREYIEALGGELQLRATFPGRPSVTIKTFSDVGSEA
jgi:DNA-binding transcriptional regulator YiaG